MAGMSSPFATGELVKTPDGTGHYDGRHAELGGAVDVVVFGPWPYQSGVSQVREYGVKWNEVRKVD